MLDALKLDEKLIDFQNWSRKIEVSSSLEITEDPSAYPFGEGELCESRVNIICGTISRPVSG